MSTKVSTKQQCRQGGKSAAQQLIAKAKAKYKGIEWRADAQSKRLEMTAHMAPANRYP